MVLVTGIYTREGRETVGREQSNHGRREKEEKLEILDFSSMMQRIFFKKLGISEKGLEFA